MLDSRFLEVKNLSKYFPVKKGLMGRKVDWLKAVDDVSFKIRPRETLGVVGESGCGKSTIGRMVIGLLTPTNGEVLLEGINIHALKGKDRKQLHRRLQFMTRYQVCMPACSWILILGFSLSRFRSSGKMPTIKSIRPASSSVIRDWSSTIGR